MFDASTTRADARGRVADLLRGRLVGSAALDARLLVCAACGIDHAGLIRDPDHLLGPAAVLLSRMVARRLEQEPVSRILGQREFWGLALDITPAVLDPRPETEGLVASILDAVGGRQTTALQVLDLGTGSGAILCALLSELPAAFAVGVDRSVDACRVARANLLRMGFGARSAILCANWADALRASFDVVVANPPYIAEGDLKSLECGVRDFDPLIALNGGPDGLTAFREITGRAARFLKRGAVLAFECGTGQGAGVASLMRDAGCEGVMIYRDLAGHDRIVVGARPS